MWAFHLLPVVPVGDDAHQPICSQEVGHLARCVSPLGQKVQYGLLEQQYSGLHSVALLFLNVITKPYKARGRLEVVSMDQSSGVN